MAQQLTPYKLDQYAIREAYRPRRKAKVKVGNILKAAILVPFALIPGFACGCWLH